MNLLHDLLFDYTLRTVALGAASLGAISGTLGAFAVLRRQSLLGDAISHAALPGIVLAFLITGSKGSLVLVLGAAVAGWIGTLLVISLVRASRVPEDSALGIVLSVFFGLGLVLLTYTQKLPNAAQAGLDRFLFGQAATLLEREIFAIAGLGGIAVAVVLLFWKEFKLLAFDREFGATLGFPMRAIEILLTTVLVVAIVSGLQTVGVVLMSSMVVAPAAAARQWTNALGGMVLLSALFGALAGVTGALLSAAVAHLPTGPTIVLAATVFVIASMLFAPERGLVWARLRRQRSRRAIVMDAVLEDLLTLSRHHRDVEHGHAIAVLETMGEGRRDVLRTLKVLEERGLAHRHADGTWSLSEQGLRTAELRFPPHTEAL